LITPLPDATTFELSPAPAHLLLSSTWQNADSGDTYGAELSTQWQATNRWRFTGSYTYLHVKLRPYPSNGVDSSSPQHQFELRSYLDLPWRWEFNAALYYVDDIVTPSGGSVAQIPAYVRVDFGFTWRPAPTLEMGLWAKNLSSSEHREFASQETTLITDIPRAVLAKISWRF
jgi:iron complex outermembrane recepter protein